MSPGILTLRLLVVAALIGLNAFFVSVEFALVAVRRTRMEQLAKEGNKAAETAVLLLQDPDKFIAAAQLGITMASLALGWVGDVTIAAIVEPPLAQLIGHWNRAVALTIGTVISFGLVTYFHIILGEQVPKSYTIRAAEGVMLHAAPIMKVYYAIFKPFIWLLDISAKGVLSALRIKHSPFHGVHTIEELKMLVRESQSEGILEEEEEEILTRAFEFSDRYVREAMIPRPDVVGVPVDSTVEETMKIFLGSRHARYPVYEGDMDHVVGVVSMKEILVRLGEKGCEILSQKLSELDLIHPILAVPETRRIGSLFAEMRAKKEQMALVIDEFGGTAGIVTIEELVEEIVGRLSDQLSETIPLAEPAGENTYIVDAQSRVDEINEEIGVDIPEGDEYETLAGFLLYQLGRIPKAGDEYEYGGLRFIVREMEGPKIVRVEIQKLPAAQAATPGRKET